MSSGALSVSSAAKMCLLLLTLTMPTAGQHEHQGSVGIIVDQVETQESVAAMRQRIHELESTVSVMRKQLDSTVGLASTSNGAQQSVSVDTKESIGSKIRTDVAEPVEEQQPRGGGDIAQDLAVELADLGSDLVLEVGSLAVLGTLFFLSSKAKLNVPSSTLKKGVVRKGPVGAAEKGCGRWVSAKVACDNLYEKVYTRDALLKRRVFDLQDGCGARDQIALKTTHVDRDHANITRPSVKPHCNRFRLSSAAQPSLRPSWMSKQSVPLKPLTQRLLQCLEDAENWKNKDPCNIEARSTTLRPEELGQVGTIGEHDVKIMNEEITEPVPAERHCQREHTCEGDSGREAAQPLVRPRQAGREERNEAEEVSQVVQERLELRIPPAPHEPTQEVLDQHEGDVRALEADALASETSQVAAAEEAEETELVGEGVQDCAKAEHNQAGEAPAEVTVAEQQQQSNMFESFESLEMPENKDVAGVEKEQVVIAGDEQLSGVCDDARASAAGGLVAVSSWLARQWPTPLAKTNPSTGSCELSCPAPDCLTGKTGKAKSLSRMCGRAGKVAIGRTCMSAADNQEILDLDKFEDDARSSLTRGQWLLRALVDSAIACRDQWSCKAQQPEAEFAQAPQRGEKMGRKCGRQQPRTTLQKQKAAKAPAASKPWQCPCGVPLTISITAMLTVCVLGRLNLDAIGWSPLLAADDVMANRASVLTGVVESAAAVQHDAIERLEALQAEKRLLTLQQALLELDKFQTEASDMMAKHPGIPEASKLEGFTRDAKALHGALQELTGAEFPQVEASYKQVLSTWKSTLASTKKRLAGGGSCTA